MPTASGHPELGKVIILSGAVGSGKTTVAKVLVPSLPDPACYIEGDQFWFWIAKSSKRSKKQNFHTIMRSMTAAAIPFAKSGLTVLLDFSIPPHFLTSIRAILKDVPFDYVVLHPSLEVCARRAAERAEGRIVDYDPYRSFYELFNDVPGAIREDEATPAELAERIQAGLAVDSFAG